MPVYICCRRWRPEATRRETVEQTVPCMSRRSHYCPSILSTQTDILPWSWANSWRETWRSSLIASMTGSPTNCPPVSPALPLDTLSPRWRQSGRSGSRPRHHATRQQFSADKWRRYAPPPKKNNNFCFSISVIKLCCYKCYLSKLCCYTRKSVQIMLLHALRVQIMILNLILF